MKNNNYIVIDEVHFSNHFEEQLMKRFTMSMSQLKQHLQYFKRATKDCPINTVRNKVLSNNYDNTIFYNQKFNMMINVDTRTKVACTTTFIDNKNFGYSNY